MFQFQDVQKGCRVLFCRSSCLHSRQMSLPLSRLSIAVMIVVVGVVWAEVHTPDVATSFAEDAALSHSSGRGSMYTDVHAASLDAFHKNRHKK